MSASRNVLEVLRAGETYLREREVESPRLCMELILAHVLRLPRLQIYLQFDRPLVDDELGALRELVRRRGLQEPLAYVLGEVGFHDVTLFADRRALVPRPETEGLVERALARAQQGGRVLDLGTGSGAIAIALAHARADLHVTAVDASAEALDLARANVARQGVQDRVELCLGDWFAAVPGRRFDLLVSNPPYVDPTRPELLADDVRRHEPALALFTAPGDPASAYRQILAGVEAGLTPGAWLLFETGVEAAEPTLALLRAQAFLSEVELDRDLAGLPRYLSARMQT
ncbi:MAG: peptide chain release factor N(5)-glutamine methyltransferase [Planctomycetota bacterium]